MFVEVGKPQLLRDIVGASQGFTLMARRLAQNPITDRIHIPRYARAHLTGPKQASVFGGSSFKPIGEPTRPAARQGRVQEPPQIVHIALFTRLAVAVVRRIECRGHPEPDDAYGPRLLEQDLMR